MTATVANLADDLPEDTAELHIVKPGTTTPTGWVITMAGPGHPQTIEMNNEGERERLHRSAQQEAAQVNGRKYKPEEEKPEENRRKFVSRICRRIVGWTPVDFGQGPLEYSHENAVKTFMDPRMGSYFAQVIDFLTAERAFMKGSASN